MTGRREYRYLSPSFLFEPKSRRIIRLKGAGLVHNPALHLTALASEETEVPDIDASRTAPAADPAMLARFAKLLGLPDDSAPDTMLSAILASFGIPAPAAASAAEHPDPRHYVPIDAVRELLADRNGQLATMREAEAEAKVDRAFQEGHITPAMCGWAKALCVQDPDSLDAFLAKSPAPCAHLIRPVMFPALPSQERTALAEEAAICAQLGLKPGALSN